MERNFSLKLTALANDKLRYGELLKIAIIATVKEVIRETDGKMEKIMRDLLKKIIKINPRKTTQLRAIAKKCKITIIMQQTNITQDFQKMKIGTAKT